MLHIVFYQLKTMIEGFFADDRPRIAYQQLDEDELSPQQLSPSSCSARLSASFFRLPAKKPARFSGSS